MNSSLCSVMVAVARLAVPGMTATLTGASWNHTNCPDNTDSNHDGGSCSPNDLNP